MACSFLLVSSCCPRTQPMESSKTVKYIIKGLPSTGGDKMGGSVATAKINRVATNIFILKRKGMPANHKTKQRSRDQRKRVRESVTRGEGISTPHAHRTRWYPRMCLNLWVCNKSTLIWTKMNAECREKKGLCSHGPYPAAYVSVLRNQSYRSSAN